MAFLFHGVPDPVGIDDGSMLALEVGEADAQIYQILFGIRTESAVVHDEDIVLRSAEAGEHHVHRSGPAAVGDKHIAVAEAEDGLHFFHKLMVKPGKIGQLVIMGKNLVPAAAEHFVGDIHGSGDHEQRLVHLE
jgi:hypothetical protein